MPHPAQQRVLDQARRFNVVDCGRRFGKTELAMRKLAETALAGQPTAYLSPIYPMLTEVYRALHERLLPYVARGIDGRRLELTTGGIIDLWSMENGADRIRGRKYARVVPDECALVPDLVALWEKVVQPTLIDLQGDAWFLSTPRRGGGFEELYRRQDDQDRWPGWKSWQIPTAITVDGTPNTSVIGTNNPTIPNAVEELERHRLTSSEQAFAQEYLADFEASESDLVYPEFSDLHVRKPTVAWQDCRWRVLGIDPGGGDPTAIVALGLYQTSYGDVMHQFGPEFYQRGGASVQEIAAFLGQWGSVNGVAVGETGGSVITDSLRAMGFPAFKAEMKREEGLEHVRMLLQQSRLLVDPNCRNSISEFSGYRWAKRKDGATGDQFSTATPFDNHADAMDARRYAVMALMKRLAGPQAEITRMPAPRGMPSPRIVGQRGA